LLLAVGRRQANAWGIVSWSLLMIVAAFNLAMSWWPTAADDISTAAIVLAQLLYVVGGIIVVAFLIHRRRIDRRTRTGGPVAA